MQAAFPQARSVGLAECGTHALFAAEVGNFFISEAILARLLARLKPGMLLLADRGSFPCAAWQRLSAIGRRPALAAPHR